MKLIKPSVTNKKKSAILNYLLEIIYHRVKINELYARILKKSNYMLLNCTLKGYLKEPWMETIISCQREISTLASNPEYVQFYRDNEIYFWLFIPKWINDDRKKTKIEKCLDIGCSYGTLALYCKKICGCDIYCIDFINAYMSKPLFEKFNLNFAINNIELDKFPWDVKFDVIILTEVLEHFNFNPVFTLKKIRELLSENGKFYLSTPNALYHGKLTKYYSNYSDMPHPQKGLPIFDDHTYIYNSDELLDIFNRAGLRITRFKETYSHFNFTLIKN